MSDELLRSLGWVGLAIGVVIVAMVVEVLLRTMINRRGEAPEPTVTVSRK